MRNLATDLKLAACRRTPIQPSSFGEEYNEELGKGAPEQRAGQPKEVATCVVFLGAPLYPV